MSPDRYDFWLLDLDGTLVDTERAYMRRALDRVEERLDCTFTDGDAHQIWHGHEDVRASVLERRGIDVAEFWRTFDRVDDAADRAAATFLYDDAAHVADLDAPVGLVTHCPEPVTRTVLAELGIHDWFDTVVCCTDDVGWKPDPAPVETAVADLGFDGRSDHRGVLVGDRASDVGAAWNAGLDGVHVERHGPDRRGHCVLGDRRVGSFEELFASSGSD